MSIFLEGQKWSFLFFFTVDTRKRYSVLFSFPFFFTYFSFLSCSSAFRFFSNSPLHLYLPMSPPYLVGDDIWILLVPYSSALYSSFGHQNGYCCFSSSILLMFISSSPPHTHLSSMTGHGNINTNVVELWKKQWLITNFLFSYIFFMFNLDNAFCWFIITSNILFRISL